MIVFSGGGISNSQIITEEGKYALDAVQNNPSVPGSLRNEIESVSGKVNTHIVNAWNDFDLNTSGGYIKLIQIKILNVYADFPLKFTVNGRKFNEPIHLTIRFSGVGSLEPNIARYVTDGNYKFYIAKESVSLWGIYAQHIPYETVCVTNAEYARYVRSELFEVTYPNILVDSLPVDSLEFTTE